MSAERQALQAALDYSARQDKKIEMLLKTQRDLQRELRAAQRQLETIRRTAQGTDSCCGAPPTCEDAGTFCSSEKPVEQPVPWPCDDEGKQF